MTGKVVIDPAEVFIAGPKSVLDNISSVTIYSSAVNISNQTEDYTTNVNIFNYLPNGVEAASKSFNGNVSVTVGIEEEIKEVYNIYLSKVSLDGLSDGLTGEIISGAASASDNKIELNVYGLPEELEDVTVSDIKVEVDFDKYLADNKLEEMSVGVYTLPVKVTLPDGLRTDDNLKLQVRIRQDET